MKVKRIRKMEKKGRKEKMKVKRLKKIKKKNLKRIV